MKKYLSLLFLLTSAASFAQEFKKNAVYLELAGNGIIYSINYDRVIPISNQLKLAPRIGFELLPKRENSDYGKFIVPLEINSLWSKSRESRNHVELGLGMSFVAVEIEFLNALSPSTKIAKVTTGRVSFRHQKPSGGFLYRIGLVLPVAQDNYAKIKQLKGNFFGGISIGYSF